MDGGRILQQGPVHEIFSKPSSLTAAGAVGVETVERGRVVDCKEGLVIVQAGQTHLISLSDPLPKGSEVYVCIRAEDVILVKGEEVRSSSRNSLMVTVTQVSAEGPMMRISLDAGFGLAALLTKQACEELGIRAGEKLQALVKAPHVHLISR